MKFFHLLLILFIVSSKVDAIEPLDEYEGYYLVNVWVNDYFMTTKFSAGIKNIRISGQQGKVIRDINVGKNYSLIKLEEGDYYWTKITLYNGAYFDLEEDEYSFRVESGKVNYGGDLGIVNRGGSRARFSYNNRSSFAYKFLKKQHPELLEKYDVIYTGYSEDPFFQLMKELNIHE